MNQSGSGFSHVLITRPRADAERLAATLGALEINSIVQPAQEFEQRVLSPRELGELEHLPSPRLLIFTSPRSVEYGLQQIPRSVSSGARFAAIGPATARALGAAGRAVDLQPSEGFTSEALLKELENHVGEEPGSALVFCAPGGREVLVERLKESGWQAQPAWVYERRAADLSEDAVKAINEAPKLLTVFTSGEAMNTLSQRLPPSAWYSVCRGEWLVISTRLQRLARAFGPSGIHLASGPQNADLATAIRSIY